MSTDGRTIYHKNFDPTDSEFELRKFDANLAGGLFSAISTFSSDLLGGRIRDVTFGEKRMIFFTEGETMSVLIIDEDDDLEAATFLAIRLVREFKDNYGFLSSWDGQIEAFQPFFSKIDEMVQSIDIPKKKPELGKIEGSIHFINKLFKKNLDHVIHGVLTPGEKIAIVGDKGPADLTVATLQIFSPHNILKNMEIKEGEIIKTESLQDFDLILTTSKKMAKNLRKQDNSIIIMDLYSGDIEGGTSSDYLENIIKESEKMSEKVALAMIKEQIFRLIQKAEKLKAILTSEKEVSLSDINSISEGISLDLESLLVDLAIGKPSYLQSFIDELSKFIPWERLLVDEDLICFGDGRRVLVKTRGLEKEIEEEIIVKLKDVALNIVGERVFKSILKKMKK